MFSMLIFAIGYIIADGEMGARLINGLSWLLVLSYIIGSVISIVYVGMMIVITFASQTISSKLSYGRFSSLEKFGLGVVTTIIFAIAGLFLGVSIFLNKWTQSNIDPTITSLSALSGNAQVGLLLIITMIILAKISTKKS